jgi:L-asparaginase
MLAGLGKPVVFTGSQRPFMQIRTDAKSNLINSVEIAASSFNEIALFFGNKLLRGNRTTKVSTWKFEAFDSPNFPTLGEAGVNINFNLYPVGNPTLEAQEFQPFSKLRETVFVIHLFPGLQNTDLDFLLHNERIEAFIIVAYGAGNMPTGKDSGLVGFITLAIEQGKIVVIATQCTHGRVSLDIYESARIVKQLRVLGCKDMTLEAAVMKLTYLLSRYDDDRQKVRTLFEMNIAGEITDEHHIVR